MTIDSRYFPEQYTTGEGFTRYPFRFEVIDPTYVQVFVGADETRTALVYGTDYTVELSQYRSPIAKNGVVVLTTAQAAGQTLWIERKTEIVRSVEQVQTDGEPLAESVLEFDMDKITMIQQEIEGHFCSCQECIAPIVQIDVYVNSVLVAEDVDDFPAVAELDVVATDDIEIRAKILQGSPNYTYEWRLDGVAITGETDASLEFEASGFGVQSYSVVAGNDCGSRTDQAGVSFDVAEPPLLPVRVIIPLQSNINPTIPYSQPVQHRSALDVNYDTQLTNADTITYNFDTLQAAQSGTTYGVENEEFWWRGQSCWVQESESSDVFTRPNDGSALLISTPSDLQLQLADANSGVTSAPPEFNPVDFYGNYTVGDVPTNPQPLDGGYIHNDYSGLAYSSRTPTSMGGEVELTIVKPFDTGQSNLDESNALFLSHFNNVPQSISLTIDGQSFTYDFEDLMVYDRQGAIEFFSHNYLTLPAALEPPVAPTSTVCNLVCVYVLSGQSVPALNGTTSPFILN